MELHELDEITEIQFSLPAAELDAALATLGSEALIALRRDCLACAARQTDIIARIERLL